MDRNLASVREVASSDNSLLLTELNLLELRKQAALARALLNEVERVVPSTGLAKSDNRVRTYATATAEELAQLGRRFLEVAAQMTQVKERL